jgi:primosomal protein N' (replication factor Y)
VAEAVIPTVIRKLTNPKFSTKISIAQPLSEAEINILKPRSRKQHKIYSKIIEASSDRNEILKYCSPSARNALVDKGIVEEIFEPITRIDYQAKFGHDDSRQYDIRLTEEQIDAIENIYSSLDGNKVKTHLLHGITGSGKTEVYTKSIDHALELGGDVIMLVPELALTPQTVGIIRSGLEIYEKSSQNTNVLICHSGLSEGECRDAWLALSNGDAKIVIAARLAIFAP